MKKVKDAPSCDWRAKGADGSPRTKTPRVRLMRYKAEGNWAGVKTERYKQTDGSWSAVIRRSLVAGQQGEGTQFHLRYFELAPGGHTSFERHCHEHVVVVVRGTGQARVKKSLYDLGPMDTLYIPPDAPHQLINPGAAPFGFFCIVDARRDRPELL